MIAGKTTTYPLDILQFYLTQAGMYPARLEGKHLVLKLADGACLLVTERLGSLLQPADHGRRTAEENLDIGSGLREPFLVYVRHYHVQIDRERVGAHTVIISPVT